MKKRILYIIIIIISVFVAFMLFGNKNYRITYTVDDYKIDESYNKEIRAYTIKLNNKYEFLIKSKNKGKKTISQIKTYSNDNTSCVAPFSSKITIYPECYNEKEGLISYTIANIEDLVPNYVDDIQRKYENIQINNLMNKNIFIWNHTGYYFLSAKGNKKINFLNEETILIIMLLWLATIY